jgi:hypothetical protein
MFPTRVLQNITYKWYPSFLIRARKRACSNPFSIPAVLDEVLTIQMKKTYLSLMLDMTASLYVLFKFTNTVQVEEIRNIGSVIKLATYAVFLV